MCRVSFGNLGGSVSIVDLPVWSGILSLEWVKDALGELLEVRVSFRGWGLRVGKMKD